MMVREMDTKRVVALIKGLQSCLRLQNLVMPKKALGRPPRAFGRKMANWDVDGEEMLSAGLWRSL